MKRSLLVLTLIPSLSLLAQEPVDALKYSWYVPGATARIQAVGGAMGSLGGDISATFVNPAGLAFYRTGDFVFTPQYGWGKTEGTYYGRSSMTSNDKFTIGTTGVVLGGGNGKGTVRSGAISLAFNRTANFNSGILYNGQNNQSSFSQQYIEQIGTVGIPKTVTDSRDFRLGPGLALQTGWIDTIAGGGPNHYQFRTLAPVGTGLLQQNTETSNGGIYEFSLGLAVNLKDKLMLGGSLNLPLVDYNRRREFIEADATDDSTNRFDNAVFKDDYSTTGVGVNIKLGLIYKPTEYWRLGFAVHSPTFYKLKDTYTANITTNTEKYLGTRYAASNDDFYTSNYGDYGFKYILMTPYRLIGSVSYVLREVEDVTKQRGFITADVEYVNYTATSYIADGEGSDDQATKDYLKTLNNAIDNAYKGSFNFRAGAELKFTTIMVRGGIAYYSNPYKDIKGESGSKLNLSAGLGYRNKGFFIDLTYVHGINRDVNFAYRLQNGNYSGATLKNTASNVLATVGFKF